MVDANGGAAVRGVFVALWFLAACGDLGGSSAASARGVSSSAAPSPPVEGSGSRTVDVAPTASAASSSFAAPEAPSARPADGGPLAGPPAAPGEPIPIPYATSFTIAPPRGWTGVADGEKGHVILSPPSGSARVVASVAQRGSVLSLRTSDFLLATTTAGERWEPQTDAKVGPRALEATMERGEGYRFHQDGRRETRHLVRVVIPLRDAAGEARTWLLVLGVWSETEPHREQEILEAVKGLR